MRPLKILKFFCASISGSRSSQFASARRYPAPPAVAGFEALSETMPTAVAPAEFSADDFKLEGRDRPCRGSR